MKFPWFDELSFNTVLNIMHIDPQNVKDIELVRRSKNENIHKPQSLDLSQRDDFNIIPFDHLSIHLQEKFIPANYVVVKGEISSPGNYPLINGQETLNSILNRSGGLLPSSDINNVIVKRDTLSFGSKTGELLLSARDTIIAKPILGTVMIGGEVHNPGNIAWHASYSAKDYLRLAGGLNALGDKKHIVYITPYGEGSRISVRSNASVLPGSIIRVSEIPLSEQNPSPDRFQQISSLVTSLVTIAILVNTTNPN
jgi:protein involved in polysaccharide export with SLBB domain